MKHTKSDLLQMQSLSLEMKVQMSKRRIREWFEHWDGQVYVSFSGGKDSTVLKHLVENTPGVYGVPVVFVDTGLEYPEVRMFATKNADVVLRPEMRFDQVIEEYGYPVVSKSIAKKINIVQRNGRDCEVYKYFTGNALQANGEKSIFNCKKWEFLIDAPFKVSNKCCDVMKKKPAKKYAKESERKPIIGTMASESAIREKWWLTNGCNAFDKNEPSSQPMSFWTEQDVLQYIKENNLEYASVYGDIVEVDGKFTTTGVNRTGCMFCMFGCHLEKEPNRFQRMKETHPRQYEYCMNKLGIKDVLEYINVPYE